MDDFKHLKKIVRENPVIKDFLDSFTSVMAKAILKERMLQGITQQHLSELTGVTQSTISRVEGGDSSIKGETYNKLIRTLNIKELHLVFDEEATTKEAQLTRP